jgi:hypothetical protein
VQCDLGALWARFDEFEQAPLAWPGLAKPEAPPPDAEGRGPGTGDLERAILEWRSTLRLIAHGNAHPWERWRALSAAAREVLAKVGPKKA